MKYHYQQLIPVLEATEIHSKAAYTWFGKPSLRIDPQLLPTLSASSARRQLKYLLESQLYHDFYCQGFAAHSRRGGAQGKWNEAGFLQALSDANSGFGQLDTGWKILEGKSEGFLVQKRGLKIRVGKEECQAESDAPLQPGMLTGIWLPNELQGVSPGFYMAQSEASFREEGTRVRLYWHLSPEGALRLMKQATAELNRLKVGFKLKVLKNPNQYTRCDSGVIYLSRGEMETWGPAISKIYQELGEEMKPEVPAFAKRLAPGLGLAEDTENGGSFGQSRCKLLAEGMIRAHEEEIKPVSDRLKVVADAFSEAGLDLAMPYLSSGSLDVYTFFPENDSDIDRNSPNTFPGIRGSGHNHQFNPKADTFRETAIQIGQNLTDRAYWGGEMCNWIGLEDDDEGGAESGEAVKALGPKLYAGSSGIALYLAQLYAETGESQFRKAALGGIRHALHHANKLPSKRRLGLFAGSLGIGYAAVEISKITHYPELKGSALSLISKIVEEGMENTDSDVIFGRSGAVMTFLVLAKSLANPFLTEFALQLGDSLIADAERSAKGLGWRSLDHPGQRCLTGFSHGSGGVGSAFLELYEVSGEARFRNAADQAFQYERYWFDEKEGNWPDFRGLNGKGKKHTHAHSYGSYWCHGSAGIALSRLRAFQLTADETCRSEALIGLHTTIEKARTHLDAGTGNYSLCHGLAGNAMVLNFGSRILGTDFPEGAELAREIGRAGIARTEKNGGIWPCGTSNLETPGLMLGLAGIGQFYLGLDKPASPGILFLTGEGRP